MMRGLLGVSLAVCAAATAIAQGSAEIATFNGHNILSAPTQVGVAPALHYEVCNNSSGKSAFFWKGAGFGVDARHQLPPRMCAEKRLMVNQTPKVQPRRIQFQGNQGREIPTWIAEGAIRSVTSNLRIFAEDANSVFEMETLILQLLQDQKSEEWRLIITVSGKIEQVVIVLPKGSATVDELRSMFKDNSQIEIRTFSYFRGDPKKLTPEALVEDLSGTSPAISIRRKDQPINLTLPLGNLSRTGDAAIMIGFDNKGRPTVRNEVGNIDGSLGK